jgi:hypothetical protein
MKANRDVIYIRSYDYVRMCEIEHTFFGMTATEALKTFRAIYRGCGTVLIDIDYDVLEE